VLAGSWDLRAQHACLSGLGADYSELPARRRFTLLRCSIGSVGFWMITEQKKRREN
jgi:hypothetical protein